MEEADKEIFVDGIGRISYVRGMIRMDLISLDPNGDDDPFPKFRERLIMTPHSLMGMCKTMESLVDKLVDNGTIDLSAPPPSDD